MYFYRTSIFGEPLLPEWVEERYEIKEKPEYAKKRIESEIKTLEAQVEYQDRKLAFAIETKDSLEEKIKKLKKDLESIKT